MDFYSHLVGAAYGRLQREQQQRATRERFERLADIFYRLGPDPGTNVDIILEEAEHLLGPGLAVYHRLNDDTGMFEVVSKAGRLELEHPGMLDGALFYKLAMEKPDGVTSINSLHERELSPASLNIDAHLGAVVYADDHPVGAISMLSSEPRDFSEVDRHIFSTLAKAVSIQEERRRADEQIGRFNETLRAIRDVSRLAVRERDHERIWQLACERLVDTSSYEFGFVASRDTDGHLHIEATAPEGVGDDTIGSILRSRPLPEPLDAALEGREDFVRWEAPETLCFSEDSLEPPDGFVAVTLDYSGIVYGVLVLASNYLDDNQEEHVLRGVANDVAFVSHMLTGGSDDEQMAERALRDWLTGLPNRTLFRSRLGHVLARSERRETGFGLLFVDLDDLKEVNDNFGHEAGDRLLVQFARRLEEAMREEDTVARIGGDEFVVIVEELPSDQPLDGLLERLTAQIGMPFRIQDREIYSTASIGVVRYDELNDASSGGTIDGDALLRSADRAMYRAKERPTTEWRRGRPEDLEEGSELDRAHDLRRALEEGRITAYFQPMFDLDTGELAGMEALARWDHRDEGVVSAEHFLALTRKRGIFWRVSKQVYQTACRSLKTWGEMLTDDFRLFLNLSPSGFDDGNLASYLTGFELDCDQLVLEITERELLQNSTRIEELARRGFQMAIDDFGTGYSSLEYLKNFDVDVLKLDMSFVQGAVEDPTDRAILEAVCGLSSKLDLDVIAEGVESEAQIDIVDNAGCDAVQGYHYGCPVDRETFEERFVE
jgi:diguanylate cyclase (GGDEF)-like protein